MTPPIISIICDVYNHGPYLRQCLDGFMNQQTEYTFEILIHDDASTDHSQEIIREYEAKYPAIIKPIYQTENQYSKRVNIWKNFQFPRVKGKYIAFCEGDDYWTDPRKLDKQISFLEDNPDYTLIYTKVRRFNQDRLQFDEQNYGECVTSYKDLLKENQISTLSVCIRTDVVIEYKDKMMKERRWVIGDYPLWLYAAGCGKIQFLPDVTCTYRVLSVSLSHHEKFADQLKFQEEVISIKKTLLKCHKLNPLTEWYILNRTYLSLLELCIEHKDKEGIKKYFFKSVPYDKRSFKIWIQYLQRNKSSQQAI